MARYEVLTISKTMRLGGPKNRTAVYSCLYEMLGTTEEGTTRLIELIEVEEYGRKKHVRQQVKRLDLETGHYTFESPWDKTQAKKWLAVVDEWLAMPYNERYDCSTSNTVGETRFLKQ